MNCWTIEDCWVHDLPIARAMQLTGASWAVVMRRYDELDEEMEAAFAAVARDDDGFEPSA